MAKRPKDPSPYLSQVSGVDPEIVSQDYNLFYKPDVKPMNKAVNQLIMSLSNIVPTLANYQITEDIKTKEHVNLDMMKNNVINVLKEILHFSVIINF